jgi:hypothetical protein
MSRYARPDADVLRTLLNECSAPVDFSGRRSRGDLPMV